MVTAASVPPAASVTPAVPTSTPTPALAPWQRLDASWPTLPDAFGLDAVAQRLVRQRLTLAVGQRLKRRRSLPPDSRRLWETRPHLAQYVRQPRFYANLLSGYALVEMPPLLYDEVRLMVEVLETPPGVLGIEVWQGLLAVQCQRIGQLYAHLCQRVGALAEAWLQGALDRLL